MTGQRTVPQLAPLLRGLLTTTRKTPIAAKTTAAALLPLALLTILAAILRFTTLGVQSYWHDEAVTALRILKPSLGTTLSAVARSESAPPLYYVLAWGWSKLFGTSELGLRSLSALIGTVTVPITYAIGARLVSKRCGLIAAAFVAVSPWLIWYSQEARAYALLASLSALSVLGFVRVLERPTAKALALWTIASSLALATHYFACFIVGPEIIWLLVALRRHREALIATGAIVASAGVLLPLALNQASSDHIRWIAKLDLGHRLVQVPKQFLTGEHGAPAPEIYFLVAVTVLVAVVLLFVRADLAEQRGARIALVLGVLGILVPLALVPIGLDFFVARNLIAAWVPLAIVVAAGAGSTRAGKVGFGAVAALCALSLGIAIATDLDSKLQRTDWRAAARVLGSGSAGRAIVAPFVGDVPLEYYLARTTKMSEPTAIVDEVDVLGWTRHGTRLPVPPRRGFTRVSESKVASLTVIRFRSRRALLISRRALASDHLGPLHAAVLLTRPAT